MTKAVTPTWHSLWETEALKMQSNVWTFRVNRNKIYWLRFILEACDGLAAATTVDRRLGIVDVAVPPGCETEAQAVLDSIAEEIMLAPYPRIGRHPIPVSGGQPPASSPNP